MTREEAIERLKYIHSCLDMTYANEQEHKSIIAVDMAIKALEQEPILDKIRAEIEATPTEIWNEDKMIYILAGHFKKQVLQIIDKYIGEG